MAPLRELRERVQDSMAKYMFTSAAFLADKIVTMSREKPCDVIVLAQAHYCAGSYRRALHLIRKQLEKTSAWPKSGEVYWERGQGEGEGRPLEGSLISPAAAREAVDMDASTFSPAIRSARFSLTDPESALEGVKEHQKLSLWHTYCLRYMAARCLEKLHEWEMCLVVLGTGVGTAAAAFKDSSAGCLCSSHHLGQGNLHASMCFLRGKAHESMGNRPQAIFWYTNALQADPFCYEAFERMVENHMLSTQQEVELVASLPLSTGDEWLRDLYSCKTKLYEREGGVERALSALQSFPVTSSGGAEDIMQTPGGGATTERGSTLNDAGGVEAGKAPVDKGRRRAEAGAGPGAAEVAETPDVEMGHGEDSAARGAEGGDVSGGNVSLAGNVDVEACRAELQFHCADYAGSYETSKRILEVDPYHLGCMPTHIAVALQLGRKNDLFLQAHRLAQEYPKSALAWFAVACYYMCTKQYDQARRYFSKATGVGPTFGPAWLGFGHAYAAQDETDQAMVAYRTAARLLAGCHLPLLCIGSEYQRSNNLPLAKHFLEEAKLICPADPLVHNELGVVAYHNKNFPEAAAHFEVALSLVVEPHRGTWEPVLVNLGHVYRKQRKYASAISLYERALSICPRTPSTFTAIGYTWHLQGNAAEAIEWYHRALGLKPDDFVASEMLSVAVAEESEFHTPAA